MQAYKNIINKIFHEDIILNEKYYKILKELRIIFCQKIGKKSMSESRY